MKRFNGIHGVLESEITCPFCTYRKTELIPVDACVHFYECQHCHTMLKPAPGDCCVFCSYGTTKCPTSTTAR
ncbi:MAG: GDCCVxC domain-containing (seleno)protein [Bacteroidota bacterium]